MTETLLPQNATPLERALEQVVSSEEALLPGIDQILTLKHVTRPSGLMPFLVYEYGLEVLRPYVNDLHSRLDELRYWAARLRGTHQGVYDGLGFVDYSGELIDPPERRRRWAEFQINLDRIRDTKEDLEKISGIVGLSIPARSTFRRGVHGYDVPAAEFSRTRLSGSILSNDSGVRIGGKGPKWSFGRSHELNHTLTQVELTALGIWIAEVPSQQWIDMNIPWHTANFKWSDVAERARRVSLATSLQGMNVWLRFTNAQGAVIGYRRGICHGVEVALEGYQFGMDHLKPSLADPVGVYVFARTGFGDGDGHEAAEVAAVFGASTIDPDKPGKLWLDLHELTGGHAVASQPLTIPFGETIREHVQYFMRF
ncbi:MAG: phage tail protein [Roseibium sp.]